MRHGFLLAMAGSLLALVGPVFLPFVTVIEEETSLAGYQLDTGLASLGLALMGLGLAGWFGRRRVQRAGWPLAGFAAAQLALMAWTYSNIWALVPCTAQGMSSCDASTGGLVADTLVTLDWGMAIGTIGAILAIVGGLLVLLAHPEYGRNARFLRVGLRWQGDTLGQQVYFRRRAVTIGEADFAAFQMPTAGVSLHQLLTPIKDDEHGWYLTLLGDMTANCHIGGQARDLRAGDVVRIGKGDAGIIDAGADLSLTFDFMAAEAAVLGGDDAMDSAGMAVSFSLAAGMMTVLLFTALLGERRSSRSALQESLAHHGTEYIPVELAQEDEIQEEDKLEAMEDRLEVTTTEKAAGEEGKLGDAEAPPQSETVLPPNKEPNPHLDVTTLGIAAILAQATDMSDDLGAVMHGSKTELASKTAINSPGEGATLEIGRGSNTFGFKGIGKGGGGANLKGFGRGNAEFTNGDGLGRKAKVGLGRKRDRHVGKVSISVSKARTEGFCEKGNLARVVRKKAAALRGCFQRELLRHSGLRGKLTLQWIVSPKGTVQKAKVVGDTMRNATLSNCVLRSIRRMRFKKPEGGICYVRWPFIFSPQ